MRPFCWSKLFVVLAMIPLLNCFGLMLFSTRDRYVENKLQPNSTGYYQKYIAAEPPARTENKGACALHFYKPYFNDKNGVIFGPIPIFWSAPERKSVFLLKNGIAQADLSGPVSCEHGCWCTIKLSVWSEGGCQCHWGCRESVSLQEKIDQLCSE